MLGDFCEEMGGKGGRDWVEPEGGRLDGGMRGRGFKGPGD